MREKSMAKVSVIIPMYKVEEYLRECLDSVANKTLKDIEVLCIDDGSPDRSAEIAAEYVKKYSNFKLIRKENGGLSDTRNVGIEAASGEYIYFLDSDDYIDSQMLEKLYDNAWEGNLDVVYFNTNLLFESDEIRQKNMNLLEYYSRSNSYSGVCTGQAMFVRMLGDWKFLPSVCLQLFRREFLINNNLRFYVGIVHEDVLFSFKCAMLAQRTDYVPDKFYFRRMRDESIMTNSKSMRNVEGYLVAYSEALRFMHDVEVEENAADKISEYMYISMYKNACIILRNLDAEKRSVPLEHGGICAKHYLDRAKMEIKGTGTSERGLIRKAYNKLAGSRGPLRLVRKALGFLAVTQEKGIKYALGRGVSVIRRVVKRILKSSFHACRSYLRNGARFVNKAVKWPRIPGIKRLLEKGGTTPLVSFILPVYNVEEYLPECLDSLLRQTMPHIEIICVDDGSTDNSLEILRSYAEKDSRIHVLTQKNQYAGTARNLGMTKATGEYLIFLDSDDFFADTLAEDAYFAAKLNKADVVIFGAMHFDHSKKQFREAPWLFQEKYVPLMEPFNYRNCPNRLYQITTPSPWTKMFRREFVLESGLTFQNVRNSNDLFFVYSALAMAKRIATVSKTLVYYRVGMSTNLQATKKKAPLCFYEAYKALHDKLEEVGLLDKVRQSYVNVVLSGCMHNLRTQKDPEARQLVYDALKNEAFDALELVGYDQDYYYNADFYEEMMKIVSRRYNYDYLSQLSQQFYPQALKKWYYNKTGKILNLENPVTYNDKINWIKLFEKDARKTEYTDKYAVRAYVEKTIGSQYLNELIGVWEDPADIDFGMLPNKFALKATHGSGWNLIVSNKEELNQAKAVERMNWWMHRKLSFCNGLELHYDGIKPRIIAEKYMENEDGELNDYKVWCFNGKAHFIQYLCERKKGLKMSFYDLDWNRLPFVTKQELYGEDVPRPEKLEELITLAEKLAAPFNHVRVDFYQPGAGVWKFGEMTFTPAGGRCEWSPPEYDNIIGSMFDLTYGTESRKEDR